MFDRNVGSTDKIIRLALGATLIALAFIWFTPASGAGLAAIIVGAVLIATALINFCPLFKIFGISSFRKPG